MGLSNIVIKAGNVFLYSTGTVLGLAALNNAYDGITTGNTGFYRAAAVQGIISAYILASNFYVNRWNKKELQKIHEIDEDIRKSDKILEELLGNKPIPK